MVYTTEIDFIIVLKSGDQGKGLSWSDSNEDLHSGLERSLFGVVLSGRERNILDLRFLP